MTTLHMLVSTGKADMVENFLLTKPDVNERTQPNGFTALHLNVSGVLIDTQERQRIIKLLHNAGADLEAKTFDKGLTPLQLAAMRGKPLCAKTLIDCGADVNAVEGNGATALHGAAFYGDEDIVKVLLEAGADPLFPDKHGNTPLSLARDKGHEKVYELLQSKIN
ncbi:MAG: ankyrin repeat domain-containing protein [Bacteroidales bacterium]